MMNDELASIAGKYEELVGRLQEKYGIAKEEAEGQVDAYKRTVEQLKKSNSRLIQLQRSLQTKKKVTRKPVSTRRKSKKGAGSKTHSRSATRLS